MARDVNLVPDGTDDHLGTGPDPYHHAPFPIDEFQKGFDVMEGGTLWKRILDWE